MHVITNFGYQISTFATKLGVQNITFLSSRILPVNYINFVLAAICMPQVNINLHNVPITYMKFFIHDRLWFLIYIIIILIIYVNFFLCYDLVNYHAKKVFYLILKLISEPFYLYRIFRDSLNYLIDCITWCKCYQLIIQI